MERWWTLGMKLRKGGDIEDPWNEVEGGCRDGGPQGGYNGE